MPKEVEVAHPRVVGAAPVGAHALLQRRGVAVRLVESESWQRVVRAVGIPVAFGDRPLFVTRQAIGVEICVRVKG